MAKSIIEVANVSDTGLKRPHNEDSAVTDSNLGLAIVADGMGGYKAGEVASALAAQLILNEVRAGLAGGDTSGAAAGSAGLSRVACSFVMPLPKPTPRCSVPLRRSRSVRAWAQRSWWSSITVAESASPT